MATSSSAQGAAITASFQTSGFPGLVRPRQPSDTQPIPVLVDSASVLGEGVTREYHGRSVFGEGVARQHHRLGFLGEGVAR